MDNVPVISRISLLLQNWSLQVYTQNDFIIATYVYTHDGRENLHISMKIPHSLH